MLGKKRNASVFVPQDDETAMFDSKRFEITPMEEITAQTPMIFAESEGFENHSMDMAGATRAHALFFAPENEGKDFSTVLAQVQEYISENYSTLITGDSADAKAQMKRYIQKFLQDHRRVQFFFSADYSFKRRDYRYHFLSSERASIAFGYTPMLLGG